MTTLRSFTFVLFLIFGLTLCAQSGKSAPEVGTIAPNAVYIEAEKLHPMYDGVAMVSKGTTSGLINAKGEFIVPYGKYKFDSFGSKNGIYLATDAGSIHGFIDTKGVFHKFPLQGRPHVIEDYIYIQDMTDRTKNTWLVMHRSGKSGIITTQVVQQYATRDGMIPIKEGKLYGFKTIDNTTVVEPKYHDISSFSDGMAVVGKRNDDSTMMYGFIDTSGKEVIPLQYTIKPISFKEGIATVFYKDRDAGYGFINKQGKEVYSNTKVKYGPSYHGFSKSTYGLTILDLKDNTEMTVNDFMASFGVHEDVRKYMLSMPSYTMSETSINDRFYNRELAKIRFDGLTKKGLRIYGFLDTETRTAFYGLFHPNFNSMTNLGYDPVSKLTLADYKNSIKFGDITSGYINENGVFVIVMQKPSKE